MRVAQLFVFSAATLLVSFGAQAQAQAHTKTQTKAKADSFLGEVSQLFDCKFKETKLDANLTVSERLIFRIPGQPTATCITTVQCVRNESQPNKNWVAKMELQLACPAAQNSCPKTAMDCLTDPNTVTVSQQLQTEAND